MWTGQPASGPPFDHENHSASCTQHFALFSSPSPANSEPKSMLSAWAHRLCVRAVDVLFGTFLYVPLGILFLKKSLSGFGDGDWDSSQIPDLHGKVAVVTGGNAGIGYHTVRQLAAKGAKVYLAARSESRAKEAIKRLREENPDIPQEKLVWLPLDLSSQAQVVDAARDLMSKTERLDILVNNAGVDPYNYVKTADGFEMTMAVNHIGHWTLTYCLLPLLKATAAQQGSDVRVITLSSSGERNHSANNHFTTLKDLDDPCAGPGWEDSRLAQGKRYGTSKLANILFATELQRRMDEEGAGILSLSLNPGTIRTEGAADVMPLVTQPLVWLLFTDAAKGADTTMFAATAREVRENSEQWKGRYLDGPGRIKPPSPKARDAVAARNLWNITAAAVKGTGALEKL
ncbi:Short-chain dehydrogenase [Colletotrichum higginsianum IMI 349063]|uniref:Short chain dehydrogenase/reductase dpchH n=3 Tax=Colletotrichum higginsianum TaxID=80884 RepID=DPCHH_COLHI|nr:Short-chain dehydrogenase [Colletotrichum higginsianum IMI 349063]A0A1B7YCL6.1 RecName: Full=Short chain dehydrogenase/reductase dpchH; AltName: Full=Diterpenoid pyrone biosynthesis cluster protein H [Colletotrichum higginsianum IMI 349063]OBR09787.1 Short-chain dehydrogenase [Colletotrichum higginsianum IMI 349063]